MVVQCDKCDRYFNDYERMTICPHPRLEDIDWRQQIAQYNESVEACLTVAVHHLKVVLLGLLSPPQTPIQRTDFDLVESPQLPDGGYLISSPATPALTLEEADVVRCAINRILRAGPIGTISWEGDNDTWSVYCAELERIREKLRTGPPDERSRGL